MDNGKSSAVPVDCIIKLGGSAITDKNELEKAKMEEITRAVKMVAGAASRGRRCLVIHGAGSFGHHHAKAYDVNQGYSHLEGSARDRVMEGFSKTRISVCKLNHLVTEEFVCGGLNAVAHSPCGVWETECGQVIRSSVDAIRQLVTQGFLPVIHGDCVLDTTLGCTILSGDTIIKEMYREFKPKLVVFLSDVAGVFTKPPDQPNTHMIEEILVSPSGDINLDVETASHAQDVTGGIKLKLQSAVDIVHNSRGGTKVFICDITSPAATHVITTGDVTGQTGTLIHYKS